MLPASWRRLFGRNLQRESRDQQRTRRPTIEPLENRVVPANFFSTPGGYLTGPNSGGPLDIVLGYLTQHRPELGFTGADLAELRITDGYTDAHNGLTHIYIKQQLHGLDVWQGQVNANVTADGRILSIGSRFVSSLAMRADDAIPTLTAQQAVFSAAQSVGLEPVGNLEVVEYIGGVDQEVVFAAGNLSLDPIPARLVYDVTEDGQVRLSWQIVIKMPDAPDWFHFDVDATNGAVHHAYNYVAHASYNVYDVGLKNPDDGARGLLTDPAHPTFSPFGWHDTNGVAGAEFTDTRGNNTFTQEDQDANNSGGFRPDGGAGLNFDFPLDFTQQPANYASAAIAQLFYTTNALHDVHARYGFTEVAGNFQEMNYSGQGAGSDGVNADAQDGGGFNNANFGTPPDGSNPRMQMFLWTTASPMRDGDFDTQIVVHEYGHGVSTRLTGGPADSTGLQGLQSGGMGEGWSDWWALALLADASDIPTTATGVGTYALAQSLSGGGIRRYRYSGDDTINPLTYGAVTTFPQVHAVGEIWASTLWDLYHLFVARYGFDANLFTGNAGNNRVLQVVMDGLKIQPRSPTLTDARDAILQADLVNNGGANQDIIWQAFAGRGIGFSANDGGNHNDTDVVEAYDLPPAFNSSISGQKFNDEDADGVKDALELGLPGWTIYLDANNNGVLDASNTVTRTSTDVPKNITDDSTVLSNLVVSGLTANILDINVTINITHTATGDLGAALISPNGTRINLFAGIGGNGNNFTGTIFDAQAATFIYAGVAPYSSTFRPAGQLGKLANESPNGTWRLQVWDAAGGDSGQLTGWSIQITTGDATALTNATGNYSFANLQPGTFVVREVLQPLWSQTFPATGFHSVTLGLGQNPNAIHFGNTLINRPPTNVNPFGPYSVQEGNNLSLGGSATDPENDPLVFTWDINGDGVFTDATGQNVVLTWVQLQALTPSINDGVAGGTVFNNVRVRVNDGQGNSVTSVTTTLTVTNRNPTAVLANDGPIGEGGTSATVNFTSQLDPSNADTAAGFRYSYDFNNDGIFDVGDGLTYAGSTAVDTQNFSATFAEGPGTHRVRSRIFDKDGGFSDVFSDIIIANLPPTATLDNNGTFPEGGAGAMVSFSNQQDPSLADTNAGFRYSYDFNNDGIFEIGNGTYAGSVAQTTQNVPGVFLRDGPGVATINARIIDKDDGSTDVQTFVNLTNVVPAVAAPAGNPPGLEGTSSFFNLGSFTDPGFDNPWQVTVNWGDGQSEQFNANVAGVLAARSHAYVDDGTFQVSVTVNDGDGGIAARSFNVAVSNAAPKIIKPGEQTAIERQLQAFDLGSFSDRGVNDGPWNVSVNWQDGTPVQNFAVAGQGGLGQLVHRFPRDGTFQAKVTVRDADGGVGTKNLTVIVANTDIVITGTDAGGPSIVRVYDSSSNALLRQFNPFADLPTFTGGARVAAGDVTGDGRFDFIIGSGPGMNGLVRIFDGVTGAMLDSFAAYDPGFISQTQGVYVATGDINFDGRKDVITGAGGLSQQVSVFTYGTGVYNPANRAIFERFNAFPGFGTIDGVTVASADINGDTRDDLIAGAGPGGPSRVGVFTWTGGVGTRIQLGGFQAFETGYRRGIFVTAADLNNNSRAEIIVGVGTTSGRVTQDGPNGGRGLAPRVRIFTSVGSSFFGTDIQPYPASVDTGVRVGSIEEGGFGRMFFATGHSVPGKIKKFEGKSLLEIDALFSEPTFTRGLWVAGSR